MQQMYPNFSSVTVRMYILIRVSQSSIVIRSYLYNDQHVIIVAVIIVLQVTPR